MRNLIQINPGVFGEEAVYKEQVIFEYQNNPFIEALPNIQSKEEVIEKLSNYPEFNRSERNLDIKYRVHVVQRLFQYFQVLPFHTILESELSRMIRQGYIARNPLSREFVIKLNNGVEILKREQEGFSTTGMGLAIVGESGMGKSITINRILSLYPQVIIHSDYKGNLLSQYQLVWLKIDCPHDGSLKGLCLDFLIKVDKILGTNYYNSSKKSATNTIIPVLCQVVSRCGLGLLVIDEIQNISLLKSGGQERFLNFFMTLMNTIGTPVVLIGTNKAMSILQNQFRQARRSIGQGTVFFERIKSKDDASWKLFVEGLFSYQWVKKPCRLSQEISDILYEESQGIFDIAIKLYVMSQLKAIVTNKEEIVPKLIRYTAKEHLKLVRPIIDTIKSGNPDKMALYDDIVPIDMNEFVNQQLNHISINDKIREIQQLKRKEPIQDNHIREEAIVRLIELDVEPNEAKMNVDLLLKRNSIIKSKEIVKLAYRMIIDNEKNEGKRNKKDKDDKAFDEKDLRFIVAEGKKKELTAYEALLNAGAIKQNLL